MDTHNHMDPRIPNFNGKDFSLFKYKLQQALQSRKLDYLLEVPTPLEVKDFEYGTPKVKMVYSTWKADDKIAQPILTRALTDTDLRRVKDCASLYDMVAKLSEVYSASTTIRRTTIYRSIATLKMRETDTMQQHCDTFTRLLQELSSARGDSTLEMHVSLLLLSVSSSWVEAAKRIEHNLGKNAKLIFEDVVAGLLAEESDHQARSDESTLPPGAALITTGTSCYNCSGRGHISSQCPSTLQRDNKQPSRGFDRGRGRFGKRGSRGKKCKRGKRRKRGKLIPSAFISAIREREDGE